MRSGCNDFNYFKLTKLANFVQFKRMLMFLRRIGGTGLFLATPLPLQTVLYHTFKPHLACATEHEEAWCCNGRELHLLSRGLGFNFRSGRYQVDGWLSADRETML